MTHLKPPRRRFLLVCLAAVLAAGWMVEETDSTAADSSTAPRVAPPTTPPAIATAPATEPAIPDAREAQFLTDVTQLTSGFDRAGEGYFSKDRTWIIFQATPKGETQYQMYVAKLEMGDGSAPKTKTPIRISPPNSRNTCGFFSPDGKTVIFASTAGKEKPDEPNAGYQRQGNNYRWAFPDGMEIYSLKMSSITQDAEDALLLPDAAKPATNPSGNSPTTAPIVWSTGPSS